MSALVSPQDKELVTQTVNRLCHQAQKKLGRNLATPDVSFRRSGKNAGTAFLQQNRINLHPVLFHHNRQAFFADVIPHEVSHLVVFQCYGRVKPHGREWQYIMLEVFNTAPQTTHSFDISVLNIPTFLYQCSCQQVVLSVRRHNNVKRGQRYQCRRCKSLLQAVT